MDTSLAVEVFLQSRVAKNLSPKTVKWYRDIFRIFSAAYTELPNDPTTIESFLAKCHGGDERRYGYFRALKALYRFLYRRFKIPNIIDMVEAPQRRKKLPKPISLDQLDQLLSFPHSSRTKAILTFLAESGARIGELAKLQPEDIFESSWGSLIRVNGKSGERIIPIGETTKIELLKIIPFEVKVDQLTRLVSQAFRDAHVKGSAHRLRHTFGTFWEGDKLELKRIMGHSNLSTTELYRGLRLEITCEEHHKYNPLKLLYGNRQSSFFEK